MTDQFRAFSFILHQDRLYFYENDAPCRWYGPYTDPCELLDDLDLYLNGRPVDYIDVPEFIQYDLIDLAIGGRC